MNHWGHMKLQLVDQRKMIIMVEVKYLRTVLVLTHIQHVPKKELGLESLVIIPFVSVYKCQIINIPPQV